MSKPKDSALARFFREASKEEREQVFQEVARKASEKQNQILDSLKNQPDIPENVRKVFRENPHIRKVVTATEIYWRGLKAYLEDPHREVDSRPHVTMDIEGTRIQLSPPREP